MIRLGRLAALLAGVSCGVVWAATPLSITKSHSGNFKQGQIGSWSIAVGVGGNPNDPTPVTATVTDTLPAGYTLASASPANWSCSGTSVVTCIDSVDSVTSGFPTLVLNVNVPLNSPASVQNTATVSCACAPNSPVTSAADTVTVDPAQPDLTITKSHVGSSFTQGQTGAQYSIAVTNGGPGTASGTITVTDALPTGLTFASGVGTGWNCSAIGQNVTCTNAGASIAPNGTSGFTLNVNVANNAGATLNNSATVACSCTESSTSNNTSATDSVSVGAAQPDLTITKSHVGSSFTQGQPAAYTVTVNNTGLGTASGTITVTDSLPVGLSFSSGVGTGWNCSAVGQAVTCTNTSAAIPTNGSSSFTLNVNVASNATSPLTNSATVSCSCNESNANNNNSLTDSVTVTSALPDLTISKAHVGPSFTQGQQGAQYTLTVTNGGAGPANGTVTVTDTLPTGLTFVSGLGTGWSCSAVGQAVTCNSASASIAPTGTSTITLSVSVANNAASPLSNTAVVGCSCTESSTSNNTSNTDLVTVNAASPDLTISKAHAGTGFTQGQQGAQYLLTVTNSGAGPANGTVTVTDTLPAGLTFASGVGTGWNCSAIGQNVTCTNAAASIAVNGISSVTLNVNVSNNAPASLSNTASVACSCTESNTGNNTSNTDTVSVGAILPDLTVSKAHVGASFAQGQQGAQYTLTVNNIGSGASSGTVTLTDVLPAGLTFASGAGGGFSCAANLQTVTCTNSSTPIAAGGNAVITLNVNVASNAGTPLTNTATVACSCTLASTSDNTSNVDTVTVTAVSPDLTISKAHVGTGFTQGQQGAQYTITVNNIGAGTANGTITVTDTLPAGLTFASGTGTGWNCSAVGQTVTCTDAGTPIAGSGSSTITLNVNVANNASTPLSNTATVACSCAESSTSNNSSTPDSVTVTGALPDLTISKAHVGTGFTQGQQGAQYTLTVNNIGAGASSGTVTVTDTLPAGLTFAGGAGTGWTCSAVGQAVTCSDASTPIAANGSSTITLSVNVAANASTPLSNTAAVACSCTESSTSNNTSAPDSVTVTGSLPDLTITKAHVGANFTQGQTGAQYTLTVNNGGSGATTGTITVSDTLPSGLTFASGSGGGFSCSANPQQAVSCTNAGTPLAAGGTAVITLSVNVASSASSTLSNTAAVACTCSESSTSNNTSNTDSVSVAVVPDLTISKLHVGGSFTQGQQGAQYTLTVNNIGGGASSGTITVTDTLPAGLTFASGSGGGFTCSAALQNVTCTNSAPIPAGGNSIITLNVNVASNASTPLSNAASVACSCTESSTGNNTSATDSVTVNAAVATKLGFSTQPPANGTAGTPFSTVVQVQDSGGNVVTGSNATVTISSTPSGLSGTLTATAVNGVATFNNLVINGANSYTLTATSNGLTQAVSSQIVVAAGTATQVVFTTVPTNGTAGQALTPAVVVKIEDQFNNVVNSNAAVTVSSTPSGVTGTLQANAVSGVATFNNLVFNATNSYTLTAASAGLTSATSGSFTISAGSGSKLVFTTQPPAGATAGQPFSAVVTVEDAGGNVVTGASVPVTISSSPNGVAGTTTVSTTNGVATFNNLTVNNAGSYTLTAAAGGLTNATSTSVNITAAPASQVVFTTAPGSGTAGQTLSPAVVAKIQDAFGNVVNSSAQVTVASTPAGVSGTLQVNATNGVATFNGLVFSAANNYTLTASSTGLTPTTSPSFTISAGSGSKLVFTTQPPSSGTAGTAFNAVVQVEDANGNVVTGSNAEVTIASTPAGLSGTATVSAVNGVATFNNLVLKTAGSYTLTATSTGLTNATSTSITIGAGAASQVVFTTAPNSGTAGQVLTPAVVAMIEDQFNNVVGNSSVQVTVSSTPAGVSGTTQVNAVNGVATFNNLQFNGANNYTLTASSAGLASATSASFTITAGSGNKLVFTVQPPASGAAGQALNPSVVVQVQDAVGNLVTGSTAAISIGSTPAGVSGTLTMNASGGVATFNNLIFTATGNFTLTATSTGLSNATSTSISIAPGPAAKLAFAVQPSSGTAGQALSPAVAVQIQDANGNLVTGSSAAVTISSTQAGVGGTLTANAVGGIATFSSLSLTTVGNYTLTAASPGLTSATSSSFTISSGSGNKLAVTVQPPSNATAGQALNPSIVVQVQDANGNLVANSTAAISIGSTPTGVSGTLTVNASSGVATFNNVVFNGTGSYTLTATSTGLSNATSTPVVVAAGAATKLAFTVPPSSGTAGQALTPGVVVQIQDNFGNLLTTSTASVTISSAPAGVGGTVTATAVGGIATFNNLTFTAAGNFTLTASSAGLTSINSNSFTISPGSGNRLAFATEPAATGTAGQPLAPVVVQIKDANGNLVTTSTAAVSISANPAISGGTLSAAATGGVGGTLTVNAVGGVATFNNLVFTTTGSYTLVATSTGLANASSTLVAVGPGPANKVAFVVQPASGTATQPLTPAVVVQIQDANGNLATGSNAAVNIASSPVGVGGTVTVNALGGIATFNNLTFTAANNYSLIAISSGLGSASSNTFTIAAGAPGGISVISGSGQTTQVTKNFANPLVVIVRDTGGNPVPNVTVTFAAPGSGASGTFGGSGIGTAITGLNGQATSPSFTANSISGTYNVTATATGVTSTAIFTMTNVASLSIVTSAVINATQAAQYNQQLIATGGTPPYTWSLGSGSLPAGLNLAPSGLISGTPTSAGTFTFTAHVRDSLGAAADQGLSLAVASTLAISSCPAATGIVNLPYSSTATATGGQTPYTWSFASGAFPPGLTLNALSGAVAGTPSSSGTFSVTLVVTDKSTATAQLACGFTIAPALSITTQTVSDASQSAPYTQTLIAAGGKPPYTWTLVSGVPPAGIVLSPSGTLSGTPTQTANNVRFTIAVTDSTNTVVQQTYVMNVFAGLIVGQCPGGIAEVGFPYNSTLTGEGGAPPYTWSVSAGLPPGLQLNAVAGTISGTPTQVGTATLAFTVTDRLTHANSKQCPLNVQPPVTIPTTSLAGGSTGASYADGVSVSGGVSPYVYSTTGGSLPPGLAIDGSTGKITGRPIASGVFAFTVQVTDNLGAQSTKSLSINVSQGLTIPNCPAPIGNVGQSYTSPLVAQGGSTPYTWSISSGSLPAGLILQSTDTVTMITGTPSAPGASAFVVQAVDAANSNITRACSIQINSAPLTIGVPQLPTGLLGTSYSQTLTASGGRGPYVWSIVGSGAPTGFSIDSTGVLSGVPSTVGTYTFTVQVTDQDGNVAQQSITVTILAGTAPNVTITGLSDIVDPATQPTFNIQLSGSYPAPIDGTVTMTVVPDPAIGVDDPSIRFANGSRTLKFTVPANSTNPVFVGLAALQTGTVAVTIQLNVTLSSAGQDITPSGTAVRSVRVDRLAPKIVSMTATQTASGIQVQIVGYSTTRDVTQGTFQFAVSGGGTPLTATVQLSDTAKTWFASTQSNAFGGQFTLTQPFTLQGTTATLTSVTVTLSNGQGTSAPATASFQ